MTELEIKACIFAINEIIETGSTMYGNRNINGKFLAIHWEDVISSLEKLMKDN